MTTPPQTQPKKRGWRYWLNLIVAFFLIFYVILLARGLFIELPHWSRPARNVACCDTPATAGLTYEEVEFETEDGLTLRGWYVPSENGANVIMAHGIDADRAQMLRQTLMLAEAGYGVLAFDLRAHGKSDGDTLIYSGDDVLAALDYLRGREDVDPDRIGVYGFSLGGEIVIQAAAVDEGIRAVIADEPGPIAFSDTPPPSSIGNALYVPFDMMFFPLLPVVTGSPNPPPVKQSLRAISPRPILLISQLPAPGPSWDMMPGYYEAAAEPKELWIFPGSGHGMGPVLFPEEYAKKITGFFDRTLLPE